MLFLSSGLLSCSSEVQDIFLDILNCHHTIDSKMTETINTMKPEYTSLCPQVLKLKTVTGSTEISDTQFLMVCICSVFLN